RNEHHEYTDIHRTGGKIRMDHRWQELYLVSGGSCNCTTRPGLRRRKQHPSHRNDIMDLPPGPKAGHERYVVRQMESAVEERVSCHWQNPFSEQILSY